MVTMNSPYDPNEKNGRRSNPRARWYFFALVLFVYLWQGFVTGNWTNGMSKLHREMFFVFTPILAGYFIWMGVRFLLRSRSTKSD